MSQQRLLVSARQKQSSILSMSSKMWATISAGNFGKEVDLTLGMYPSYVNVHVEGLLQGKTTYSASVESSSSHGDLNVTVSRRR